MNKKIAYTLSSLSLLCLALPALAQTIPDPLGGTTFCGLLTKIGAGVGEIIAGLGTVMIIISGILFLISAGNPQKMQSAKSALFAAIAGIVIGLAATAIIETIKNIIGASGVSC